MDLAFLQHEKCCSWANTGKSDSLTILVELGNFIAELYEYSILSHIEGGGVKFVHCPSISLEPYLFTHCF